MHQCLTVPEIVREICSLIRFDGPEELDDWFVPGSQKAGRKALVNLSRTCRTFYQPATEELWSTMAGEFGLDPVLDMMADDLWDYVIVNDMPKYRSRVRWHCHRPLH